MLQQAVDAGFCESLLLCQSSSTVFSDVIVIVSPARFGQERSLGEKLCSILRLALQPLLNVQWKLGSIQASHSFSAELSVGVANVECSQSDAWGASEHTQPIWTRHWGNQFPNVKSARPPCYYHYTFQIIRKHSTISSIPKGPISLCNRLRRIEAEIYPETTGLNSNSSECFFLNILFLTKTRILPTHSSPLKSLGPFYVVLVPFSLAPSEVIQGPWDYFMSVNLWLILHPCHHDSPKRASQCGPALLIHPQWMFAQGQPIAHTLWFHNSRCHDLPLVPHHALCLRVPWKTLGLWQIQNNKQKWSSWTQSAQRGFPQCAFFSENLIDCSPEADCGKKFWTCPIWVAHRLN